MFGGGLRFKRKPLAGGGKFLVMRLDRVHLRLKALDSSRGLGRGMEDEDDTEEARRWTDEEVGGGPWNVEEDENTDGQKRRVRNKQPRRE